MKTRLLMIIGIIGFVSLVVPNAFGICSSPPCESSPMKSESNYRFVDFSYVYYSGEPIQFTLEKTLNNDCNSYTVNIIDQDGNFVGTEVQMFYVIQLTNQTLYHLRPKLDTVKTIP